MSSKMLSIGACLLGGVGATWSVAWAAAWFQPGMQLEQFPTVSVATSSNPTARAGATRMTGPGFEQVERYVISGGGCVISINQASFRSRYGWPCYAMHYADDGGYWAPSSVPLQNAAQRPFWSKGPGRALPLRVSAAGFAADTAVFATLLWMPATAFTWLRHRRRIRLGFCIRCGYSLTGLRDAAACPECGAVA